MPSRIAAFTAVALVAACAGPFDVPDGSSDGEQSPREQVMDDVARTVTLRPLVLSDRRAELVVRVNGALLEAESISFEYPDLAAARAATIRVELADASGAIVRADVVPLQHCALFFEHGRHPLDPDHVTKESMEVGLVDPLMDFPGWTDGPCIHCTLTPEQHVGGCGGGPIGTGVDAPASDE